MKSAKGPMVNQFVTPLRAPVSAASKAVEIPPFILEFSMVQGMGFRCVAYRDMDGKWRNAFNNEELFGDIQIVD